MPPHLTGLCGDWCLFCDVICMAGPEEEGPPPSYEEDISGT